jgi:hypothetical protein
MQKAARYLEPLRSAQSRLQRVHDALLNPKADVWARSMPELEAVTEALRAVERQLRLESTMDLPARAAVRQQVVAVRRELRRIESLMESAAAIHLEWAQMLALAVNGYSAAGSALPLAASAAISVQG